MARELSDSTRLEFVIDLRSYEIVPSRQYRSLRPRTSATVLTALPTGRSPAARDQGSGAPSTKPAGNRSLTRSGARVRTVARTTSGSSPGAALDPMADPRRVNRHGEDATAVIGTTRAGTVGIPPRRTALSVPRRVARSADRSREERIGLTIRLCGSRSLNWASAVARPTAVAPPQYHL